MNVLRSRRFATVWAVLCFAGTLLVATRAEGQAANWIWTSLHEKGDAPIGPVHFRKQFTLENPSVGELIIAADDEFQVYLNGQLTGYGAGCDRPTKVILTPQLRDGDNLLAIRATNIEGTTGALVAIMRFKQEGESSWRWLGTDETWKTAVNVIPPWVNRRFDDSGWAPIVNLGAFGVTAPWDAARMAPIADDRLASNDGDRLARIHATTATTSTPETSPFSVPNNFVVQRILDPSVGSLIALEFNEFGQLILSREGGSLLLADLDHADNGEISLRKYCESVQNIQGILPLNGDVYVTGDGPEGLALYRLSDADHDGSLEPVETLLKFKGRSGEHGAHGLTLGPDGLIYVMIGNASGMDGEFDPVSPVRHIHEGDILPRIEDPGGHAAGIRAPGGTVIRVSADGQHRELVAVGVRNAYDLAFNRRGDLFFHDSDMESDVGTPWYRPTQAFHLIEGGEYGWRSGTAKFPSYFIDNLPAIADTGRGSPTGAVVYDHIAMPVRYHGALFLGDWSEGRILAVRLDPSGDGYSAEVEEFLSAQPLTVTDLAVGPDGALYFSTGGRGTEGGVYRVSWSGQIPESFSKLDDPVKRLVGRPQPQSAWTRQELARMRAEMGEAQWASTLRGVMTSPRHAPDERIRALEILSLYGPVPPTGEILGLAVDAEPYVRARAASVLGWRSAEAASAALVQLLNDRDAGVRRAACQSLAHLRIQPEPGQIAHLLASENRNEAFAARRLLETMDVEKWRSLVLESNDVRLFTRGATALMVARPNLKNAYDVLARVASFIDRPTTEADLLDLLRVAQLALDGGGVDPTRIPAFSQRMLELFPASGGVVNRELSRVLGYLHEKGVGDRLPSYLSTSKDSWLDKMQVLLNLRGFAGDLTSEQRMAAIAFLEESQSSARTPSEGNYSLYVTRILEAWASDAEPEQIAEILRNGARWPSAALNAFHNLPETIDAEQVGWIIEMDRQLKGRTESTVRQARLGCVAILGRNGDAESMSYLREVWRHETDRRDDVTLALAQQPDGPNWPYLIKSLGAVSDDTTREVLSQLATVNKRPGEPEYVRQAILTGYRLRGSGAELANRLLVLWTGNEVDGGEDWRATMHAWATWFNDQYPDLEPVKFDDESAAGKYSVDQVISFLETDRSTPQLHSGMLTFAKAQCASCHRFNGQGNSVGPDLSGIARRFSRRETVRAMLHPSEYVSDQYAGNKILTTDGRQLLGLVTRSGDDYVVPLSDGKTTKLAADEIEEIVPAETSVMPEGLLDKLSIEEVRDLVGWMYSAEQVAATDHGSTR